LDYALPPGKTLFTTRAPLPVYYLRSLTVLTGTLSSCKMATAKINATHLTENR